MRAAALSEFPKGADACGAGMAEGAWVLGLVLPGGLALVALRGAGATADVWEAAGPAGHVAVKALRPSLVARQGMAASLMREARKGQALRHPGLVQVLGTGYAGGRPYIVMELLRGRTLAEAGLARLPRPRVAHLLAQPAAALVRLHAAGLVHGDVKPGNLFLETGGGVRLLDLGAARMAADSALDTTGWMPPHGLPAVTPRWAAPERLRGEPPDPRDDIYSLALVAAWLMRGPPPRALLRALGPRAGRPTCAVALVRSMLPWGIRWLA